MVRRYFMKTGLGTLAAVRLRSLLWNLRGGVSVGKASTSGRADRITDLQAEAAIGNPLYDYDPLKWLYMGWENDHPKSWTFMGGGLAPGQQSVIQYTLTIGDKVYCPDELAPDRQEKIKWYLREGYLPCPVSEWDAGPVKVEIQHFANRILDDSLTAVYSRVRLTNTSAFPTKGSAKP